MENVINRKINKGNVKVQTALSALLLLLGALALSFAVGAGIGTAQSLIILAFGLL